MHQFLLSFAIISILLFSTSCRENEKSLNKKSVSETTHKEKIPAVECYPDMGKYVGYPTIGVFSAQTLSNGSIPSKNFLGLKDTDFNINYENWRNSGADCQIVYIFFASKYDDNNRRYSGYKLSDVMSFDNRQLTADKVIMMKDKWIRTYFAPGEIEKETSIFIIDAEYSAASRIRSDFKKRTYNK